jgi:hypothetical protein
MTMDRARPELANESASFKRQRPLVRQYGRFTLSVVTCTLTLLCTSHSSWAFEESAKSQALERYQAAKANLAEHRYCEAAGSFNSALVLTPLPVLALWAGHASARCGNLVAALAAYTKATQLTVNELWLGVKQQRAQVEAADSLAELRVRVPKVMIDAVGLGDTKSEVTIDGELLSPDKYGTEVPVNPGSHVVVYSVNGKSHEERFTIEERKVRVVHLGQPKSDDKAEAAGHILAANESGTSVPTQVGSQAQAIATVPEPDGQGLPVASPALPKRRFTAATVVSATVGSIGIVAGVVTRIMAFQQKSTMDAHCDQQRRLCDQTGMDAVSSATSLQNQSTVYLLLGAAGITSAIGFYVAGSPSSQTSLTAVVLPAGAGLGLERSF